VNSSTIQAPTGAPLSPLCSFDQQLHSLSIIARSNENQKGKWREIKKEDQGERRNTKELRESRDVFPATGLQRHPAVSLDFASSSGMSK
jgi:hypothetical protein